MDKSGSTHIESIHSQSSTPPEMTDEIKQMGHRKGVVGTVQLLDGNDVVLIPTPSPDPKGKRP